MKNSRRNLRGCYPPQIKKSSPEISPITESTFYVLLICASSPIIAKNSWLSYQPSVNTRCQFKGGSLSTNVSKNLCVFPWALLCFPSKYRPLSDTCIVAIVFNFCQGGLYSLPSVPCLYSCCLSISLRFAPGQKSLWSERKSEEGRKQKCSGK